MDTVVVLAVLATLVALWLGPLIHLTRTRHEVFNAAQESRGGWIAKLLFGGSVGGLLYLLIAVPKLRRVDHSALRRMPSEKVKPPLRKREWGDPWAEQ